MPLYHQIVVTVPKCANEALVNLFKKHTKLILSQGGVVRGIENQGVRPLPERATKKFATADGTRHFWEARFTTTIFDASPKTLTELNRLLKTDENVIRTYTIKQTTTSEKVNSRSYKNPFLEVPVKSSN